MLPLSLDALENHQPILSPFLFPRPVPGFFVQNVFLNIHTRPSTVPSTLKKTSKEGDIITASTGLYFLQEPRHSQRGIGRSWERQETSIHQASPLLLPPRPPPPPAASGLLRGAGTDFDWEPQRGAWAQGSTLPLLLPTHLSQTTLALLCSSVE